MALTRLDNLISSKTGKYLYVSPDDFNASDELNNRGNSPIRPFKSIQRAFLEIARYSYLPGPDNDRFDQFTIMLMPGNHYIDNRPGIVSTTGIDAFSFNQALNQWEDSSNLDISDPNNILYLFNNTEGGAILPRGSSLVGYDLRRTVVRPLYVPDPADRLEKRSAIFNVTGGCYFWQFTIKDGDLEPSSPLYDKNEGIGKVYYQNGQWSQKAIPNYSHHKLTVFEYADKEELGLYYQKISKAFSQYQPTINDPGEFTDRIQETRIVGPLSDIRSIDSIKCTDSSPAGTITVEVATKVNHGYFKNQFITIENNGLDDQINGTFPVVDIDLVDARKFSYQISGTVSTLGTITSLVSGTTYTAQSGLSANAVVKAEVDSVESASPYVFNCSIRSTWGICGIWANGLKTTGFKSMVIAQYTGVSLQKDDRAFIRYDEYSNTFNQASLTDAFATVPYHTKGDAYWKDDWRNFHVRASEDSFIQCVSIFAVGFADHFLMESGGDMSITNSNSNFGNTSLHAIGHKGYAFNQDKGGYITDIIPPKTIPETVGNTKKSAYYTIDVKASNDPNNHTKIYYGDDEALDPAKRPAASIDGFRIGARSDEKLFVKLTPRSAGTDNIFNAKLTPNGFKKFNATASILNPSNLTVNNRNLDAADRIEENKNFIAHEAYGYITGKYPNLLIKSGITIDKCRRDIGYLIDAAIQDLRLGGNINTIQAAESYYVGANLSYIIGELTETLEGYNYARDIAIAALRNFAYLRQGASTTAAYPIVDIGDTSGIVQGMVVADYDPAMFTDGKLNAGATRPASPAIPDNTFVKRVVNATQIELGQKAVYSEKKLVSDRFGDAKNLIVANKTFIASEAYDRMVLDFPGFVTPTGNSQDCKDDIIDVIEAVAENVAYGGNADTFDAAYFYETGAHVAGEEAQTIKAFEYARDMCIQVMRNEDVFIFGSHALTQTKDTNITYIAPELVADRNGDARTLILSNKELIATESVARMTTKYPNHVYTTGYTSADCVDDVRDLLEAVADNLAYGGNDKTWDAAYSYVHGAHVVGEETETVYAFEQAKEMIAQVVRNQKVLSVGTHGLTQTYDTTITYDTPDPVIDRNGDARNLIIGNKALIAREAYSRMLAQNAGFVPPTGNQLDCIDDIIDFIEEVSYNLAYGGNDRTWDMANLFVTGQHVAGEETQTVQAFEFARDLMIQVMRNEKVLTTSNAAQSIHTPTTVGYDAATGVLTLTIPNHGMVTGDKIKINNNSLTFTCTSDGDTAPQTYPRASDPISGEFIEVTGSTVDTVNIDVGSTPLINHDISTATYDAATGNLVLTSAGHGLDVGEKVQLADGGLSFTCSMDSHATTHVYPRPSDPAHDTALPITNIGFANKTATGAIYDPSTGSLTVTVANHGYVNGDKVRIADGSLTFTCAKDGNATNHSYPRATDPCSGQWLTVSNKTSNTFDVNIGVSPDTSVHTFVSATADGIARQDGTLTINVGQALQTNFTPTGATYNPITGDMELTIGTHTLAANTTMTPTGGTYDPNTGVLTVTSAGHGLLVGDSVKIADGAFKFTCANDSNATEHDYPRATDPASDTWLKVLTADTDTFTVDIGVSPDTSVHAFVSAVADSITQRGATIKLAPNSLLFDCDSAIGAHLFVSAATDSVTLSNTKYTPTGATYDPNTGLMELTIGSHNFTVGTSIDVDPNSINFTCAQDGNTTTHSYPRTLIDSFTVTGATYTASTGAMTVTVNDHGMVDGDWIKFEDDSLTFTCDKNNNSTPHTYPRSSDPVSGKFIQISNATQNTFDVNVGESPAGQQYTHLFVGTGVTNGLKRKRDRSYNQSIPVVSVTATTITINVGTTPLVNHNVTGATYDGTTGALELTIGSHSLTTGQSIKLADNSLTFSCNAAVGAHTFVTGAANGITDDGSNNWTADSGTTYDPVTGALVLEVGSHSLTPASTHTVTDAVYNAATGAMVVTVAGHGFSNGDRIKFAEGSISLNCAMDGNVSTKTYPRKSDPTFGKWLQISSVTTDTFSVDVGSSPLVQHTPTGANYNPTTGIMELTIGAHSLTVGTAVKIADNSLTFTCAEDSNATQHTYPRATDPFSDKSFAITDVTATTISVQVLSTIPSTNTTAHTFVSATNNCVTSGGNYAHTFVSATASGLKKANNTITFAQDALTFTCDADNNATQHTYPRATDPFRNETLGLDSVTATTVTVNVGIASATTNNQGTYPRASGANTSGGADYAYDTALPITATTGTTITININGGQGAISNLDAHTFVSATAGAVVSGGNYAHTFVSADADAVRVGITKYTPNASTYTPASGALELNIGAHTFKAADQTTATGGTYDAGTGVMTLTVPGHGFKGSEEFTPTTSTSYDPVTGVLTLDIPNHGIQNGEYIRINDNSLSFTCAKDSHGSTHTYPRATDPASNEELVVSNVTQNTLEVNIGVSPDTSAHICTAAVANSVILSGDKVKIIDNSLTFTCGMDSDTTNHTYPRVTDYASGKWLTIGNKTTDTFEINVGTTPVVQHNVTDAVYNPTTGFMTLTIPGHGLTAGTSIKLANESLSFSCTYGAGVHTFVTGVTNAISDSNSITHTAAAGTTYDPATGLLVLEIGSHTLTTSDTIQIADNAVTFTCDADSNATQHTYPRATDPASGQSLAISAVTGTTITVDIGIVSTASQTKAYPRSTDPFYDTAININSTTADTITLQILGTQPSTNTDVHTFVSATAGAVVSGGNYPHTFVSAVTNGVRKANNLVSIADNSLTFTCDADAHASNHTYPRSSDPVSGKLYGIDTVTNNTINLMIGPSTNQTSSYPRAGGSDYAYNTSLDVIAVTGTTVTVNVNGGQGAVSINSAHTFSSALEGAVITGGNYAHTFVSAVTGALISGGNYIHTYVSSLSDCITKQGITQFYDNTITVNVPTPVDNKSADARELINANKNFISEVAFGRMMASFPTFTTPTGNSQDCIDDIKDIIDVIAYNLAYGGNDRVWDASNLYAIGAHVAGEEVQTVAAFNHARDMMIQVIRNEAVINNNHSALNQIFDTTITADTAAPTCQSQVATINTLSTILTNTVTSGALLYGVTRTRSNGPCDDVSAGLTTLTTMVTEAITNPGTLVNVVRSRSVGSCEDVRTTVNTLIQIVQNAVSTPASLSSVLRTISNGSCHNVASAVTTLFQILTNTVANPGYLQSIDRVESPLGLAFGPSVNANASTSNSYLYFTLTSGVYTSDYSPTVDDSITQHTTYPECADQASAIRQYFTNMSTIIQTGLNTVPRNEPSQLTTELASRSTVWTLRTGVGSNPHNLETGTPVRLVPRPRWDSVQNKYVDVDKRKVRLPNGFNTNAEYYVIAPARKTKPEPYENTSVFNGTDQTKIMLASSKENAAAGIYIHSAEVESIDADIEIDIYQFVLDDRYDLHEYACILESNTNTRIRTDVPHIFDVPFADISGHEVFFRLNEGGSVPLVGSNYAGDPTVADVNGRIRGDKFFWARYQTEKTFTVHATKADAIADINAITFQSGTYDFSVFADKRESPVRYDPSYLNPDTTPPVYGKWYMQVEDHSSNQNDPLYEYNILTRLHETTYSDISGQDKTNDSWFERIKDERDKDDRIYRLRYVIPEYLQAVRDPINGFSIKIRKDETRKLLPQKLVLKPVSGSVTKASFFNPVQANEKIGYTKADFINYSLVEESAYDPYKRDVVGTTQYSKIIETSNYVSMTIESGRYFTDTQSGDELLEITVFDQGITNAGLVNDTFTTVKITAPQGGNFVPNKTQSNATNRVDWFGNSSGYAFVHAVLNVPNTSDWYLILKGVSGNIDYSQFDNIRFTQGDAFSDLLTDEDFGKSLYIKDLIRKGYPEYYYRQNGSSIYTVTPGDIITDDDNVQFYVASVEDTGEIDDTFYIFDVEEIQRRIYGQQDGIYYLTAVRGNVSPYPTGAGNQGNFKNMKFSQPISKLYPLNYKNDPLWFKQLDNTEVDVPATSSAADNYIHGLVRVNDFKGSMTREAIFDFVSQSALVAQSYTQINSVVDNRLRAQKGNATSGSEDRLIPIIGDSTVMSDMRLYVELRRPSIARAGNHTFEYLGFGPGNYSTGLPARQEIVLAPIQDFYAQSKKQDGGLVFYTGLNSNGDLYIGNRKIDAITGEEVFLESAQLVDSEDDADEVTSLVTTFDNPVTFNEYITVNGGDAQDKKSTFNSPVVINVLGRVRDYALQVVSNVSPSDGDDATLDKTQQFLNQDTKGDIVIARNRVAASIFQFNPRGSNGGAQGYKIQNHVVGNLGSNITPNQSPLYSTGLGTAIDTTQNVLYGSAVPLSGDMLLKGSEVGGSGSLGWVYANYFEDVPSANIQNFTMNGSTVITITWGNGLSNDQVGVTSGSQIRISNYSDPGFNGLWQVIGNGFSPSADTCQFAIIENRSNVANDNPRNWSDEVALGNNVLLEFSNSSWKEFGVLGAEAIRTKTDDIGNYKLGINTVARTPHTAYQNAFVDVVTDPRANLDVVGNAFISGKTITNYLDHAIFSNRTQQTEYNALLVGGDSADPTNAVATLRVSTKDNGRVGINVTNTELDRALVVDGESRFTGDARFQEDIEVHGGGGTNTAEIRTDITSGQFNFLMNNTFVGEAGLKGLKIAGWVKNVDIGNETTDEQHFAIGTKSLNSNLLIATIPDDATNISKIEIGGAYNNNESLSFTRVKSKSFKVDGDFQLGSRRTLTDTVRLSTTAGTVSFFSDSGSASIVNFATNASEINIAGQGGTTTINNQLEVIASAKFNGNIWMCGGLASFAFNGARGQAGSVIVSHDDGILSDVLFNKNIDILNVKRLPTTTIGYNQVDTAGAGDWGGSSAYQQTINIGGTIQPTVLPALTGDHFYLPLKNEPVDVNGNPYFVENDYILVDSPVIGSTEHPEFLKVVELTRINAAPYYIKVLRQPLGTYTTVLNTHPDTTPIYKVNVQFDSTWIEQALDDTGPEDSVFLAEFGGQLKPNDYVIVDREDTTSDGIYDQGEVIKVLTSLNEEIQTFRISDCGDPNKDVFIVDSVTGDTTIEGDLTVNSSVTINGGCGTDVKGTIIGDITPITDNVITWNITGISDANIALVSLGDVLKLDPSEDYDVDLFPNTRIAEIDYATDNNTIKLSRVINILAAANNVKFIAYLNDEFTITNGQGQNSLYLDTCNSVMELGNQYRRFDVARVLPGTEVVADTVARYSTTPSNIRVYSYQVDPQVLSVDGPITTLTVDATTGTIAGSVYLEVAEIGSETGQFAQGDLVLVGKTAQLADPLSGNDWEIMEIASIDLTSKILRCVPAQEGTTANPLTDYVASTTTVKRIIKHKESAVLMDIQNRSRSAVPFTSIVINKGYIAQQKLDYDQFFRFHDTSNTLTDEIYTVNGGLAGKYHVPIMNEDFQDDVTSRTGELTINNNLNMIGGSVNIKDSTNNTQILAVGNDDGHADHSGTIYFDAGVIGRGDIKLYSSMCPENVLTTVNLVSFQIDVFGDGIIGNSLNIRGEAVELPPKTAQFKLSNLGPNGVNTYTINKDQSIDAFGLTNYYTTSGGRHSRYVSSGSEESAKYLSANVQYFANVTAGDSLILYLPDNPQTGDSITVMEVGGNLTYDTTLILRAQGIGTRVQGDANGTTIGIGGTTPYASGEMIVQTPNAAFTLVYLGSSDSSGTIVSSAVQGWWLKEV